MDAFTVDDLIACYERGVFPMADAREDESIFLIDPERRGVLPLDGVHIPVGWPARSGPRPFEVRIDSAFDAVVEACATSRPGRLETWINAPIQRLYGAAVRARPGPQRRMLATARMVGGLYGVSLGAAFFGESMFSTRATPARWR
jgi:leucyl/phenylalanyl-tRNA--protein transferase